MIESEGREREYLETEVFDDSRSELNRRRVVEQLIEKERKKKRERKKEQFENPSDKIFIGVKVTSRETGRRKLNISEVIKLSFENGGNFYARKKRVKTR